MTPKRGAIAECSLGCLGFIQTSTPVDVKYSDGEKGKAWCGFHLNGSRMGSAWSSRNPKVLGYIEDPDVFERIALAECLAAKE